MRLDELRQIKTVYTLCCRNEPRSEFLRGWLSEAETRDLVALCEEEDVSLHGLILSAGLTAMARYHRKMINQKGIQRCVMWISHFFKASISLSSRILFILLFKSSWCKIASTARNWINSVPQAAATTFGLLFSIYPSPMQERTQDNSNGKSNVLLCFCLQVVHSSS